MLAEGDASVDSSEGETTSRAREFLNGETKALVDPGEGASRSQTSVWCTRVGIQSKWRSFKLDSSLVGRRQREE